MYIYLFPADFNQIKKNVIELFKHLKSIMKKIKKKIKFSIIYTSIKKSSKWFMEFVNKNRQ